VFQANELNITYTPSRKNDDGQRCPSVVKINENEFELELKYDLLGGYSFVRFFKATSSEGIEIPLVIKKTRPIRDDKPSRYDLNGAKAWISDIETFKKIYPDRLAWSNIYDEPEWNSFSNPGDLAVRITKTNHPLVIIMERFPGKTAEDALREKDLASILDIFLAAANALQNDMHNKGMVHGDVKENNVNVFYDEVEKVWRAYWYDFNFARATGGRPDSAFDKRYMAPELSPENFFRVIVKADKNQDVYSFGKMMGRCIFDESGRMKWRVDESLKGEFCQVINGMCKENPKDRPSLSVVMGKLNEIKNKIEQPASLRGVSNFFLRQKAMTESSDCESGFSEIYTNALLL
jgi:serine/threonine protein kinase